MYTRTPTNGLKENRHYGGTHWRRVTRSSAATALDWRIRVRVALPDATSNGLRNPNTNTNRSADNKESNQDLNPDLGLSVQTSHTSTDSMLRSLSSHFLLLHLHLLLSRPHSTVHILPSLCLQQIRLGTAGLGSLWC